MSSPIQTPRPALSRLSPCPSICPIYTRDPGLLFSPNHRNRSHLHRSHASFQSPPAEGLHRSIPTSVSISEIPCSVHRLISLPRICLTCFCPSHPSQPRHRARMLSPERADHRSFLDFAPPRLVADNDRRRHHRNPLALPHPPDPSNAAEDHRSLATVDARGHHHLLLPL